MLLTDRPKLDRSYTGTDRVASASAAFAPRFAAASAVPLRGAASLAEREVQRSVQAHVSRQYQRRSAQAPPPSATSWSADRRMPHIQHDLTGAASPPRRAEVC